MTHTTPQIRELRLPKPTRTVRKYEYEHHYEFIRKYAALAGINVTLCDPTPTVYCGDPVHFSMEVDGQQVLVDYSDHEALACPTTKLPTLKFHYNSSLHQAFSNVFPVGPMLDIADLDNYRAFFKLCKADLYQGQGEAILNCQRPYGNAKERRRNVQRILTQHFPRTADVRYLRNQQLHFWNKHRDCLVAVCVPGARNNMLDRGHYEQMGLGVCVISPNIPTVLPNAKQLQAGVHYIRCKDDYSDLVDLVKWCQQNRSKCREIGTKAKALFFENCTPEHYWSWVQYCLRNQASWSQLAS